jgi:trans-2-enoyl-CoA reductase
VQVSGFNLRKWVAANRGRVVPMLEALGRLVSANMLTLTYTEYELSSEVGEALEHALDAGRNTKVLLSCAAAAAELAAALKQQA